MNKAEPKEAGDSVFVAIGDALANREEVRIVGPGTDGTRSRWACSAGNARPGKVTSISAPTLPVLKARKTVKDAASAGLPDHDTETPANRDWWRPKPSACWCPVGAEKAKRAEGLSDGLLPA